MVCNFHFSSEIAGIPVEIANAAIDTEFSGEKPPESLFMKELKRMGMTPTSLLEDYKQGNSGVDEEVVVNEQDKGGWKILITVAFFSTLYLYFRPIFVYDASKMSLSPP
ncbi:hypothetical protein AHAS_Ahas04G0063100 [Arachis hypogaea]